MDAKYLSLAAKAACRAMHFTPRQFESLNSDRPAIACMADDPEYPVLRIWNSRRKIVLTNHDLAYADRYLR